jgi:hypothetical protein
MLFVRAIDNKKWFPDVRVGVCEQNLYPVFAA